MRNVIATIRVREEIPKSQDYYQPQESLCIVGISDVSEQTRLSKAGR
jgi:hypothetical protein